MGNAVTSNLYVKVCTSCAVNVIEADSIRIGTKSRPSLLEYPTRLGEMSRYIVRILVMMRPVTRVFSANDREKIDSYSTNERNESNAACDPDVIRLGFNASKVIEATRGAFGLKVEIFQFKLCRLAPKNASVNRIGTTITHG